MHLECSCTAFGLHFGMPLECISGRQFQCFWIAAGLFPECIWNAHGMQLRCNWTVHVECILEGPVDSFRRHPVRTGPDGDRVMYMVAAFASVYNFQCILGPDAVDVVCLIQLQTIAFGLWTYNLSCQHNARRQFLARCAVRARQRPGVLLCTIWNNLKWRLQSRLSDGTGHTNAQTLV